MCSISCSWCLQALMFILLCKWMFTSLERYSTTAEGERREANPLLDYKGLPQFSAITIQHIVPGVKQVVQEFREGLQELEKDLDATEHTEKTWESVFNRLEVLLFPIHYSWGIVSYLDKVKSSPELRKANREVALLVLRENTRFSQSVPLYNAYKQALLSQNQKLNGVQLRILNSSLRAARHGGVHLKGQTKARFNDIQLQLAKHSSKFSANVIDSTNSFSLLLMDKADIQELPETTRRLLASSAVAGTSQSPDEENGPWKVGLDSPSFKPIMLYSTNRQLKEQLYKAFVSRARGGLFDNGALIEEIGKLRHEFAQILGYKNFAEYSISKNMAGSVDRVWNFANTLRARSYPVAQQELKTLQQFANSHGQKRKLQQWDIDYWDELQRRTLFSVTEEQLRAYFPLQRVLSGLFELCSVLFGITIKPAVQKVEVWHPDVMVFDVYDEKGSHIASFFMDLYSRPNEKERGSWTTSFISRSDLLGIKPVAFLTCNQLPPVGSVPSLMSFSEVKALFHEFGHAMQHMLTTVPYVMAAGLNNIEWDAVEFPSQFMENWIYDNTTIPLISGHYLTGEPLPQTIFAQLLKAHHYGGGSIMLRQMFLTAIDLSIHTSSDSWTTVVEQVSDRFTVMKQLPVSNLLCSFLLMHIFSGGYAAGYYAYEWAEVFALDAFAAFEDIGLQNQNAVSKIGRRFRDTVLSLGGGTHPAEVFRMFRGHDPHLEYLLKAYGI